MIERGTASTQQAAVSSTANAIEMADALRRHACVRGRHELLGEQEVAESAVEPAAVRANDSSFATRFFGVT